FRKAGRAAHVDEHADDEVFLADMDALAVAHEIGADVRRQDRNDRDVGLRLQLAGQADRGILAGADPRQHEGFPSGWFWQGAAVADDLDAAGGAAGAAAADARVRNIVAQARLQHAQPLRYAHLAARIRHRDHSAPALVERARPARREYQQDRRRVTDREIKECDV